MKKNIDIADFDYNLPDGRIAKYPLARRWDSKLLAFRGGVVEDRSFTEVLDVLPSDALVVFNRTKVVRARLEFHKPSGARIEVLVLEPSAPSDYARAFGAKGGCSWHCMVGNARKFNCEIVSRCGRLRAVRGEGDLVHFSWSEDVCFGELLESVGSVPIPPYLGRESDEVDTKRYQTTYAEVEGSVAAPTAGLHFSEDTVAQIPNKAYVTLHVGAGTFLPVKTQNAAEHTMHTESFCVSRDAVGQLAQYQGRIVPVGTTSLRTIESLAVLGGRIQNGGTPCEPVGQWERYDEQPISAVYDYMTQHNIEELVGATQIMITPDYRLSTIQGLVTNFHQPKSTLLMLISAVVGDRWRDIYAHALESDYRFLSYGDSSYLEYTE